MRRFLLLIAVLLAAGCGDHSQSHLDNSRPPGQDAPNAATGAAPATKIPMH